MTPKTRDPLWLGIRLTHFPLESLNIQRHHKNIMLSHKNHICATTDNLLAQGIEPGTPTATAQLLHTVDQETPCRIYARELDREEISLTQLCEALYNITPHIEIYRVDTRNGCEDIGILLEISRCIALFKGIEAIIHAVEKVLAELKLSHRCALGHSKHIAWLLTYSQQKNPAQPTRADFIEALKPLALKYLNEYPNIISQLKKTGFFCFGDLIAHIEQESLHSLRRRFGEKFSQYLSDTLAIDNSLQQGALFKQPADSYQPKNTFIESIQFDYPVSNCEQLLHPVKTLLAYLSQELITQQQQTQTVSWHLYDIYQHQEQFTLHFERLHRDPQLAIELTMIRLENQPLPFEVDCLELRCEQLMPVHYENMQHENMRCENMQCEKTVAHNPRHHDSEKNSLTTVTAKLNIRLGENAVFTLSPKNSHIPELSFNKTTIANKHKFSPEAVPKVTTGRPSWIFNIPIKIGKRQNALHWKGSLELLQGPERIEGLWWKKPTGRDYFVAKRDDHVRLWIFHDLYKNAWFVHGVFA